MGKYGYVGRTHKDFVKDVAEIKSNIKILSKYKGYYENVKCKCLDCGEIFERKARLMLSKVKGSCPECWKKCAKKYKGNKLRRKRGAEKATLQILELFDGKIKPLQSIKDQNKIIKFRCDKGHEFERRPKQVLQTKTGCFWCGKQQGGKNSRIDKKEFLKLMQKVRGLTYHSNYTMLTSKCKFICDNGHIVEAVPAVVLDRRCKCQRCFSRKLRKYKLGNRIVMLGGYEDYALDYLQKYFTPDEISVSNEGKVPVIPYFFDQERKHYPDIFVPQENLIIEVKSTWTIGLTPLNESLFCSLQAKCKAAIKLGYTYKVLLMDRYGNRIKLLKDWHTINFEVFVSWAKKKRIINS